MELSTPTFEVIKHYLEKWSSLENYVAQESSLNKLFGKTYPKNDCMDEVLTKVSSLNDFYSTNIFNTYWVAKHIMDLKIDGRLGKEDLSLVNDIAVVDVGNGRTVNFYSFATKYCSHHKPDNYPIYDRYVEKMLGYFKKIDRSNTYKINQLKFYENFKDALESIRKTYSLTQYSLKELDKYLWLAGKEHFPRKDVRQA